MSERKDVDKSYMTFGEHLDILRKSLIRIIVVVILIAIVVFLNKTITFDIILAPGKDDFITFRLIDNILKYCGMSLSNVPSHFELISTDLSAQFMTHVTVSCLLACLLASPYIVFELFRFVSPALYESERKKSYLVVVIVYALFVLGMLMSYFILFPISFQFLATYQVDEEIVNTITLNSYISTFTTLTFLMGVIFQLPVFAYILGRMGLIDAEMLKKYRPYAFVIIMVIAAIITPPDLFTLVLVTIPIYALYEVSILVLKSQQSKHKES